MDVSEKLRKFAEEGKDWERKKTTLDGVFLLKLPKTLGSKALLYLF